MVNIIEATDIKSNEYGKGLNTQLFFDGGVETSSTGSESISSSVGIDTCIVPGNEEYPYEILVTNYKGESLHSERCSKKEVVNDHFKVVNKYKEKYFEKHKLNR